MSDFISNFWHLYVAGITLVSIIACLILLWFSGKAKAMTANDNTTGHVWDGDLREMNNPLPRWWVGLFIITIVFAFVYLAMYPGVGNLAGKLPGQLSLAAQACSGYDAQNGYQAKLTQGILVWQLPQATSTERAAAPASSQFAPNLISAIELSPNGRRVIGWARCESLHLQGIYAP